MLAIDLPLWALRLANKIRRGFCWVGSDRARGDQCRVAWVNVCTPKKRWRPWHPLSQNRLMTPFVPSDSELPRYLIPFHGTRCNSKFLTRWRPSLGLHPQFRLILASPHYTGRIIGLTELASPNSSRT